MDNYFIIKPKVIPKPNQEELEKDLWFKQNKCSFTKDFKINKIYMEKLYNIVNKSRLIDKNIINLFICGLNGVGKYTLARAYINEYLGLDDYSLKPVTITNDSKELEFMKTSYHSELVIYKYNFNDFNLINKFFETVCRDTDNSFSSKKNIVLIKNIELIRSENLYLIKNNIERYSPYNVFILISNKTAPAELKGYFALLRIPKIMDDKMLTLGKHILKEKKIKYKSVDIKKIVKSSQGNISKFKNLLQYSYVSGVYQEFEDCDISKYLFLYKLLKKKNFNNLFLVRELITDLLTENITSQEVLKFLLKRFLSSTTITRQQKSKIIQIIAEGDKNDTQCFRNIIQLEYVCVQIINIL